VKPRLVTLSADRTPPTEFRVLVLGQNPSEKGTFTLSGEGAAGVLARFEARGTDVSIDYDHSLIEPAGEPKPAAGWGRLELRPDGIWLIGVTWTDRAAALLSAGEYRYFSPVFEHDEAGQISNLVNVALTNTPALHDIAPLVAASAKTGDRAPFFAGSSTKFSVRGTPAAFVVQRKPTASLSAAPRSTPMDRDKMMKMLAAALKACGMSDEEMSAQLAKMGSMSDEDMAAHMAKMGEAMGADPDKGMDGKDSTPPPPPSKEADTAASALSVALSRDVQTLSASNAKLQRELEELKAKDRKSDCEAIVAQAEREGRITPAMGEFRTALLSLGAEKGPEWLRGHVKLLSVQAIPQTPLTPPAGSKAPAAKFTVADLTPEQLHAAKACKVTPEAFVETLNRRAGRAA